jgi:protein Tex
MVLEGTVTNVTNFGAFVDVGVHQDGLVHISMLANKFVKDPREVVKAGDVVKVKVLEVDEKRKRIALTMRLDEQAARPHEAGAPRKPDPRPAARAPQPRPQPQGGGAMAEALAMAFKRKAD